jgi:hypothetical protein
LITASGIIYIRSKTIEDKKQELITATSVYVSLYEDLKRADIPQRDKKTILNNLRFGDNQENYYFMIDMKGVIVHHPFKKDLEELSGMTLVDEHGVRLGTLFISEYIRNRTGGFVKYSWKGSERNGTAESKLAYIHPFDDNRLLICSLYLTETENEFIQVVSIITLAVIIFLGVYVGFFKYMVCSLKHSIDTIVNGVRELNDTVEPFRIRIKRTEYEELNAIVEGLNCFIDKLFIRGNEERFFYKKVYKLIEEIIAARDSLTGDIEDRDILQRITLIIGDMEKTLSFKAETVIGVQVENKVDENVLEESVLQKYDKELGFILKDLREKSIGK